MPRVTSEEQKIAYSCSSTWQSAGKQGPVGLEERPPEKIVKLFGVRVQLNRGQERPAD